jgi:hypothetical protein
MDAMAITKTTAPIFRIDSDLKEYLLTAAVRDHRSIANMVKVLIRGIAG